MLRSIEYRLHANFVSENPLPDPGRPTSPTGPKKLTVFLFVLGLTGLFGLNSWKRDFGDPDEALFAQICRGMTAGSWVVPEFAGPFLELPPLGFWLPAALHKVTGMDPRLAYRVPVLLAAALSLVLTYLAGKRFFDGRIGFLALLIQGSTGFFFWRASWLDDDLLFAVWIQLAITLFAAATRHDAKPLGVWLGWIALALAALTKSAALAIVLALGTLLPFLFLEQGLESLRSGVKRLRLLPGFLLFLGLVLPWYVLAGLSAGTTLYSGHVVAGHADRLWNATTEAEPPYYYLGVLLLAFLPWTFFLPLGLLHGKDRLRRHGERLTFLWVIASLLILTLADAKKPGYILGVWPPLSLLIAAGFFETRDWYTVWEDFLREGVFALVPLLLKVPAALVLVTLGAYFGGYLASINDDRVQEMLLQKEAVLWTLALATGVSGVLFFVSGRVRKLVHAKDVTRAAYELACASLLLLATATFFHPASNPFLSGRDAVERLAVAIPADAAVALYGQKRAAVFYYLDPARKLTHLGYPDVLVPTDPAYLAIEAHLKQPGPACLITSSGELESLRSQFASLEPYLRNVRVTAKFELNEELVLVLNR